MLVDASLFSKLSQENLRLLENHATIKIYKKNTVIIEEGDISTSLYILIAGAVRIYTANNKNRELTLGVLDNPGDWFGELALVGETKRTASVVTIKESRLMIISQEDFLNCLQNNPHIALELIRHLVCKIKTLTSRVSSMALNDVYGRVSAILNDLTHHENDQLIINTKQRDIANMAGTTRERVNRILSDLKQGGYIRIEDGKIVLLKKLPIHW